MSKQAHKPDAELPVRQKVVAAGTAPRPLTTAANSVFTQAGAARKPRYASPFDPLTVTILKNKPMLPQVTRSGAANRSRQLLERMANGDCAQLTHVQARSVVAQARKLGIKVASRRLDEVHSGVWRLS